MNSPKQLHVATGEGYYLFLDRGLSLLPLLEKFPKKRVAIISDRHVWALYGKRLLAALPAAPISIIVLNAGEEGKSLSSLSSIYQQLADARLHRDDLLLAFGGGVVSDVAGFAASTYMRGMAYVNIPTTLLSQVDSSIGGKTAINLPQGKNLVGAFWQPTLVLVATELLSSLPKREFDCGMAEVLKYALISSENLCSRLENPQTLAKLDEILPDLLFNCLSYKADIVQKDPFDHGLRRVLNFGHTFGHAIEKQGDFSLFSHGHAVALGMVLAGELGVALGITPPAVHHRCVALLNHYSLATEAVDRSALAAHIALDKKADSHGISMVFLTEIGCPVVKTVNYPLLYSFLKGESL